MKKPNYIEVRVELKTKLVSPAVNKYFKRMANKVLQVNFAEKRSSKLFDYEVRSAGVKGIYDWSAHKDKRVLCLELVQIVPDCYKEN